MEKFKKEIDYSNLLKARDIFEKFRVDMITDRDKAGAVQAFEFCYELAWKTMKRILSFLGIEVRSPRETFREAALNKIIDDPNIWFDFIRKRNLTTHTYDQDNLEEVLEIFEDFSKELNKLINKIEKS